MNIKALVKSLLLRKFTSGLLIIQLAITLALVVNSVILALDTRENLSRDTGMDNENILLVSLHPTSGNYRDLDYYRSVVREDLSQLARLPGVKFVSAINQLPLRPRGALRNVHDLDNPEQERSDTYLQDVKVFFGNKNLADALGLSLLEGRYLNQGDQRDFGSDERPNIVISESLKLSLYGEKSAIGQETNRGRIVGVIRDISFNPTLPEDKQYAVFDNTLMESVFVARYYVLSVEPGQMSTVRNQVSDTILAVQPERDIFRVFTMAEHLERFYRDDQGLADLFLLLCALMLLVTAISSYAYAQFHISRQKKYIGIRRALGARKRDILLYVLTENALICVLGCLLGVVTVIGFNVLLSQYISLSKPEPLLFLLASGTMFIAGILATWLPALNTSNIPPVIATRTV
ncbi:ABC transporter permease [Thalassomonas haliotis]|uniref:FtsX-like permease family protein n=1 Tax=Thalassomonas haliotis TaxID=485448 RepID=A0ABY7VIB4_9GAMM|nr:FtsX-like permease family protein [Thalassomonas haliotis]WDE13191.1 FtsX-like permease family protein [Thalassomonas haliotis]